MICSIDGCDKSAIARGWCSRHYDSWRYHGDPLSAQRPPSGEAVRWIKDHVGAEPGDCLIWPFYRRDTGYAGCVWPDGVANSPMLATRFMCWIVNGEPPTPEHEAAHSCGKGHSGCIHPKHLRWATRQQNVDDKHAHGTSPIGELNPSAKLDAEKVREIRRSRATLKVLAQRYGVSKATVGDARTGRTWGHVQ